MTGAALTADRAKTAIMTGTAGQTGTADLQTGAVTGSTISLLNVL